MRWNGRGAVAVLAAGVLASASTAPGVRAQTARTLDEPQEIRVARVDEDPDVDGVLSEAFWADAPEVELTWEITPGYNTPAPVSTSCRFARNDEALLLGCTASDPDPDDIRAYITDRDALDGQDRIVLTLDPFADARRAFRFTVSALGVQGDALVAASLGTGGGGGQVSEEDPSWDAIWASAGRIGEDGYGVEAAIPFRSLRFPAGQADRSWYVQIERVWPRNEEVRLRNTPVDRADSCRLCQSDVLSGLGGIEPGMNVQVTPTVTAARTDQAPVTDAGDLVSGDIEPEFGITGRWGLTPGLTLGVTANPDFSQVEADVAQLDVNNQFTLFFPERRPFFLEGSDVFATPVRAVFTRTIADPSVGAKLSGKTGPWALGFMSARDEAAPLLIPGPESSRPTELGESVTTVVGRARRDMGRSSTVGVLYTGRESASYHNRVAGVDALVRPVQSLTLRAQALLSSTDYPDAVATAHDQPTDRFTGTGLRFQWEWGTRDWQFGGNLNRSSHDLRLDAGFQPQVGNVGGNARIRRIFWGGRDRWFSRIFLEAGYWRNQEIDGPVLNGDGFWFGAFYRGPLQSQIAVFPNVDFTQHFRGESWTGMNNLFMNGSIRPWADVAFQFDGQIGDAVDFANVRLADQIRFAPSVELRAGRHVTLSLAHTVNRLSDAGREIFTAQVTELRGWYNFSPRSFIRVIAQNRTTDRNPNQYTFDVDPEDRSLFVQALYSYKLNPETVFFLGYGDDRRGADRLLPTSRTFFLKLGYAWRP